MKRAILTGIMTIICFITSNAFADVIFVAQQEAGTGSGKSYDNRASVATHNSGWGLFKDLDGHTVVLCGKISTAIKVPDGGSNGKIVIYDGKASAYDSRTTNALITGHSSEAGSSGFYLYGKSYVTVKNLKIDWNYTSELGSTVDYLWGLRIQNSHHIVIDSVNISKVHNGLAIHDNSYNIRIVKSIINKIAESGVYIGKYYSNNNPHDILIGGHPEDGNTIKNCTYKTRWENNNIGYDIRMSPNVKNITISYNHLYSDTLYHGMSAILVHSCQNILIEYNTIHDHQSYMHRPAISIKGEAQYHVAYNIIIRFNKIFNEKSDNNSYAESTNAIVFSGNWKNAYIYGNLISNCGGGINANIAYWISPPTHSDGVNPGNMHIWSNVINNTSGTGIGMGGRWDGTDVMSDVFIYNNTLYRVAFSNVSSFAVAGITNLLSDAQDRNINVKNNIIMDARINASDQFTLYSKSSLDRVIENNTHFLTNLTFNEKLKSKYNNDEIENPLFQSTNKGDFSLSDNSPCRDNGVTIIGPKDLPSDVKNLAGNFGYEVALDPFRTDWEAVPVKVSTLKQSDYGISWEKGAYVYINGIPGSTSRVEKVTNLEIVTTY